MCSLYSHAAYLIVPMDYTQENHLKAYGIAYWVLEQDIEVDWLLNYRGGSFLFKHYQELEKECIIRGNFLRDYCRYSVHKNPKRNCSSRD